MSRYPSVWAASFARRTLVGLLAFSLFLNCVFLGRVVFETREAWAKERISSTGEAHWLNRRQLEWHLGTDLVRWGTAGATSAIYSDNEPLEPEFAPQFEPPLAGQWFHTAARSLRFVAASGEQAMLATPYTMRLGRGWRAASGTELDELKVEAPTTGPILQHAALALRGTDSIEVTLDFGMPIELESLRSRIELEHENGTQARLLELVPARSAGDRPRAVFELLARPSSASETMILRVHEGVVTPLGPIRSPGAALVLKHDGYLHYEGSHIEQDGDAFSVAVRMGASIELATLAPHVHCDPPRALRFAHAWNGFTVRGAFLPGERVQLRFEPKIAASDGRVLAHPATDWLTFPDFQPAIELASSGTVLLATGARELELSLRNVPEVELTAWRLFPNQIANWTRDRGTSSVRSYLGEPAGRFQLRPGLVTNRRSRVALPLDPWIGALASDGSLKGTYLIRARDPRSWAEDERVVTITDLAITARRSADEVLLWVTSISTGQPTPDVEVEVRSLGDQVLGRTRTDARGLAHLKGLGGRAEGAAWFAWAQHGNDAVGLELERGAAVLGMDAEGRAYQRGADVFLFAERTLARPGEVLHFGGWLRNELGSTCRSFPLEVLLERPDGRFLSPQKCEPSDTGWFEGQVPIPEAAMRGAWRLIARAPGGPALGTMALRVEDFRPDRLRVTTALTNTSLAPRDLEVFATVRVERSSGGPARDLEAEAELRFQPSTFRPPVDPRYCFAPPVAWNEVPAPIIYPSQHSDAEGGVRFDLGFERFTFDVAPLEARFGVTVMEPGGRSVSSHTTATVIPKGPYLACAFPNEVSAAFSPLKLELAAFDAAGQFAEIGLVELRWQRIETSWVFRQTSAGSAWEELEDVVEEYAERVTLEAGRGEVVVPADRVHGRVRWSLHAIAAPRAIAASGIKDFRAGELGGSPDRVAMRCEPESCAPGEAFTLHAVSPFAGQGLLTLECEGVVDTRVIAIEKGANAIALHADAAWMPTLHAALSVVRPNPGAESSARAVGHARLAIVPPTHLALEISALRLLRPRSSASIEVRATGAKAGDRVALWAIDESVLAMSGAPLPDPMEHYFGLRRGRFETRDFFSRLLPELDAEVLRVTAAFGGDEADAEAALLGTRAKPEREAILGHWLGTIALDADGRATAECRLSETSGRLRFVALLATDGSFARAEHSAVIADEFEIELALPGALAPGDQVALPLLLRAREASAAGAYRVELRAEGALKLHSPQVLEGELACGAEALLWCAVEALPESAVGAGAQSSRVLVKVQAGAVLRELERKTVVRRADAPEWRHGSVFVDGTRRFAPADDMDPLPSGLVLRCAREPWLGLGSVLEEWIAYPWGCLEQILSRARPMLEIESFAQLGATEEFTRERAHALVQNTLDRLSEYAAPDGGLALWPGGSTSYTWGSIAALDFVLAARAAQHTVDEAFVHRLVTWCERTAAGRLEDLERCAAIEVLVRAGRTPERWIEALLLRKQELEPDARALLARALRVLGRSEEGRTLLNATPPAPRGVRERGGALRSDLRSAALWLLAAADLEVAGPHRAAVLMRLCDAARSGELQSTQESVWVLRAIVAEALTQKPSVASEPTLLTIRVPGAADRVIECHAGAEQTLRFDVPTDAIIECSAIGTPVHVAWTLRGFPRASVAVERQDGVSAMRRWLAPNGAPLEGGIRAGDLVLVELCLDSREACSNVILVDPLPAGFEIENPHLATRDGSEMRSRAHAADAEGTALRVDRVERGMDRLAAFFDLEAGRSTYRYLLRAVQPGRFAQAPLEVEAAYDPRFGARTLAGRVEVLSR